jgi:cell wall-associated NlpC family hydrolase
VDDPESYSSVGDLAAAVAKSAIGMPFEYGSAGPGTFDTSGLVYYCFKESGIRAPRLVSEQFNYGTAVEKSDLKPGDVVFFSIDTAGKAEYVGIYIGNDTFIAARSSQNSVGELYMSSSYWQERYVGARRYF